MKYLTSKVQQFQEAFNQEVNQIPTLIDKKLATLRFDLMMEENEEYLEAVNNDDLTEIVDALTDQLYILCGTILSHGAQHIIEDVFNEVHRSNMSKLDESGRPIINGENGVFDSTRPLGKVLKSARYSEPDIKQFLP